MLFSGVSSFHFQRNLWVIRHWVDCNLYLETDSGFKGRLIFFWGKKREENNIESEEWNLPPRRRFLVGGIVITTLFQWFYECGPLQVNTNINFRTTLFPVPLRLRRFPYTNHRLTTVKTITYPHFIFPPPHPPHSPFPLHIIWILLKNGRK